MSTSSATSSPDKMGVDKDDRRTSFESTDDVMAPFEHMAPKLRTVHEAKPMPNGGAPAMNATHSALHSIEQTVASQQLTIQLLQDELIKADAELGPAIAAAASPNRRKTPNRRRLRTPGSARTKPLMEEEEEAVDVSDYATEVQYARDVPYLMWRRAMHRNIEANKSARAQDWAERKEQLDVMREYTPPRTVPWHVADGSDAHLRMMRAVEILQKRSRATITAPAGDDELGHLLAGWPSFAERQSRYMTWSNMPDTMIEGKRDTFGRFGAHLRLA